MSRSTSEALVLPFFVDRFMLLLSAWGLLQEGDACGSESRVDDVDTVSVAARSPWRLLARPAVIIGFAATVLLWYCVGTTWDCPWEHGGAVTVSLPFADRKFSTAATGGLSICKSLASILCMCLGFWCFFVMWVQSEGWHSLHGLRRCGRLGAGLRGRGPQT